MKRPSPETQRGVIRGWGGVDMGCRAHYLLYVTNPRAVDPILIPRALGEPPSGAVRIGFHSLALERD